MTDPDRPRFHFTAPSGWINDPYGVTWRDGRYRLFFQWHPPATQWSARMAWGQADSPDLLGWSAPQIALEPSGGDEAGCWSGTVVMDGARPAILYTSVGADQCDRGRIVLARSDASFGGWVREAGVLDPPSGVTHFRDPYVWRADDRWHMVVGAGLGPAAAAVLGYVSDDLRHWDIRGVACSRSAAVTEPVWTGSVWECPQLFELDGAWVLVVSVAHDGITRHVAYAVGDYDGTAFRPRRWHRLLYGDSMYATTTFLDAAGRRCALSWSREDGPVEDRKWAGALSLPLGLRRDGDRVIIAPHPNVVGLRTAVSAAAGPVAVGSAPLRVGTVGPQSDIELTGRLPPGVGLDVVLVRDGAAVLTLAVDCDLIALRRPGRPDEPMPLGAAADGRIELRLLLDAGIAEVFTPAGTAGVRITRPASGELLLAATRGLAELEQVTVHELAGPAPSALRP